MTNRRSIIIFWLLFLLPALVLGGVALRMVFLETARIQSATTVALKDQAGAVAESIDLALATVQDNLTRALSELEDRAGLEETLVLWEKTNPLVRNVFIFDPEKGLTYPERGLAATREERRFIARFDPLFSGRMAFEALRPGPDKEPGRQEPQRETRQARDQTLQTARPSGRKALYELSRAPDLAMPAAESKPGYESGWIPWFSENRLHILGWVKTSGPVYGVELEVMTLLSRLVADFPGNPGPGTALALVDGSGNLILRKGDPSIDLDLPAAASVDLSHRFPHWQVRGFARQAAAAPGKPFFILASSLLFLLLLSILTGGILMTRLTLAKIEDARKKTSFVASVSHELKTPLTSIRMYAELLLSGRAKTKEKEERYLSVIVAQSLRLTRLINNVLDFGRLEQGKKRYTRRRFEMVSFLETLIRSQEVRIKEAGLEIIRQFDAGSVEVETDRDALEQALLNLVDNALKYADKGKTIRFILAQTGSAVRVSVRDDGPGISKAHRGKIFEKFFRADDRITAGQPGSGLGLSIARQMIRDLGGDLFLEEKGAGACFTIRIPGIDPGTEDGR